MKQLPPITVSTIDHERLMRMLERADERVFPESILLENELNRANLVEPGEMSPDVVTMRSTVRFMLAPGGQEFELTLCYPEEIDGAPGKISIAAPIGSALLGLSKGQQMSWPAPGGKEVTVKIMDVCWQPEAQGYVRM